MSSRIIEIAQFSTQNELQIAVVCDVDEKYKVALLRTIFFCKSFTILMAFHLHFMSLNIISMVSDDGSDVNNCN